MSEFSFGRYVQKKNLALLSSLFQVLTPTVVITRGLPNSLLQQA